MFYNKIESEQDMWPSRFGTFEEIKAHLLSVEDEIRKKAGNDPDNIRSGSIAHQKQELARLLYQRKHLLNWMLKGDLVEMERLKIVNQRMFDLTEQLRRKLASVCKSLVALPKDPFTDDYEVQARLKYVYDDGESVLPLPSDDLYGSDYRLMMSVICSMEDCGLFNSGGLELYAKYNEPEESILSNTLDDGESWAHDMPAHLDYDEICICYTLAAFCRDSLFSVFDVLHMNDFWSTVDVEYQHFSTLIDSP